MTSPDPRRAVPWLTLYTPWWTLRILPPERLAPWWVYVAVSLLILGVFLGIWSVMS